jgi:hypothetical protein
MFPLKRYAVALPLCALAACGSDRSVNPVAEKVDADNGAGITSANVVSRFDLLVGQRVTIKPRTTTRTSRLRWRSTNTGVAGVSSTGTVTANATGTATVTVSGGWVAENYTVAVTAPAAPPAPTVTAFTLQPATGVSLLPGQTQQFAPAATWSDGQQYPLSVTYSATGGTISSTGLFTAGNTAGRFSVIATCVCGLVATSTLDVAQLTTLRISPKTVSLAAGATQAFTTTALWSTGATTLPPITYTVTGGSITSTGQYTAPSTAGTYRVIVAHTNGSARDTATVTVGGGADTGGGGTATPSTGAGPNEPMGFTTIFSNPMVNVPPLHPQVDQFGFRSYSTSTLLSQTEGSTSFMRVLYPRGMIGGAYDSPFSSINWGARAAGATRLYHRIRMRLSSNWTDNNNANTKFFFFAQGQGNNHYINLTNVGNFTPGLAMQSNFAYASGAPNIPAPNPISKGAWQELEFLIIANTPGQYNGIYRMWVNGALVAERTNIGYFAAGETVIFNELWVYPTYGGGTNTPPWDQWFDLDHWYMSVSR